MKKCKFDLGMFHLFGCSNLNLTKGLRFLYGSPAGCKYICKYYEPKQ